MLTVRLFRRKRTFTARRTWLGPTSAQRRRFALESILCGRCCDKSQSPARQAGPTVGPFCRKGLRSPAATSDQSRRVERQRGDVERTFVPEAVRAMLENPFRQKGHTFHFSANFLRCVINLTSRRFIGPGKFRLQDADVDAVIRRWSERQTQPVHFDLLHAIHALSVSRAVGSG